MSIYDQLLGTEPTEPQMSMVPGAAAPGPMSLDDLMAAYSIDPAAMQVMQPVEAPGLPAQAMQAPMPAAAPKMQLMDLLDKYYANDTDYSAELRTAQQSRRAAQQEFNKMVTDLMAQQKGEGPSKAELYFRLAAAFGAPTKTGNFFESLGQAGQASAGWLGEKRAAESEALKSRQALGLKLKEMALGEAKEEEQDIRSLAAEQIKQKRDLFKELLKQHIESGKPMSSAGKMAADEGLVPGTPEYQARVRDLAELELTKQGAQLQSIIAGMSTQQANLALAQAREARAQGEAARKATTMTPKEMDLVIETEDNITAAESALKNLQQALRINQNTFAGTIAEVAQQRTLENINPNDPRVVNTRDLQNLLGTQALTQLKSLVGGNPTEGERAVIMDLQGISAKSKAERALIIKRGIEAVNARIRRNQKRLEGLRSGKFKLYDETPQQQPAE